MTDQPQYLSRGVDLSAYEEWIKLAADHIVGAAETAIDELVQGDWEFLPEGKTLSLPDYQVLDLCVNEAVSRFVKHVISEQEG